MTASQSSSGMLKIILSRRMPAQLTRTSTLPKASSALSIRAAPPSAVAMSSVFWIASPPAFCTSATTAADGASAVPLPSRATPMSFTTTAAPSAAHSLATAAPIPRPAPVIATTRCSRTGISLLIRACVRPAWQGAEVGPSFLEEGTYAFGVLGAGASDVLRAGRKEQLARQVLAEALQHELLDHAHREDRPVGKLLRHRLSGLHQFTVRNNALYEPDPQCLVRADDLAGVGHPQCVPEADQLRQLPRAAISGHKPVTDERLAEAGRIAGDPDVTGQGQTAAQAVRRAVHCRDGRFAESLQSPHNLRPQPCVATRPGAELGVKLGPGITGLAIGRAGLPACFIDAGSHVLHVCP